jgi:hypothetical protein
MPVGMYGGNAPSGPNFFDMLVGGARAQQPVYRPQNSVGPRGRISQR